MAQVQEPPPTDTTEAASIEVYLPVIPYDRLRSVDPGVAVQVEERIRAVAAEMVAELLPFGHVFGTYTVDLDENDMLSVTLLYSGYRAPMAHPMHVQRSLVFDLTTGSELTLADVFSGDTYLEVLTHHIAEQIEEKEIPLLRPLGRIDPQQEFRLTPTGIAIYFQLYDLAPYAWGFPEFHMPYDRLIELIDEAYLHRLVK